MMKWFCFVSLTFISLVNLTQSVNYNLSWHGPFDTEASQYFEQELSRIDISNILGLRCSNIWWSLYNNWYYQGNDHYGYGFNYYIDETTAEQQVKFYKFSVTSEMKEAYSTALSISTCCDMEYCNFNDEDYKEECNDYYANLVFGVNWDDNTTMDVHCGLKSNTSLDTYLYILQLKKKQVNVIAAQDDSTCTNTEQSYIDLSDYTEGEYMVAIGGYAEEYGNFWVHLECIQYLYPIQEDQFNPQANTKNVTCGRSISGGLKQIESVKYHRFYITDYTYFPIIINVTSQQWPVAYIITSDTSVDGYDYKIIQQGYGPFVIDDRGIYTNGEYYAVIQEPYSESNYTLHIECAPPPTEYPTRSPTTAEPSWAPSLAPTPAPQFDSNTMIGLAIGSMSTIMVLLGLYYVWEWCKYCRDKPLTKQQSRQKSAEKNKYTPTKSEENNLQTNSGNTIELAGADTLAKKLSIEPAEEDEDNDQDPEYHNGDEAAMEQLPNPEPNMVRKKSSRKGAGAMMSIKGVDVRRLDADVSVTDQLDEDEDVVQAVLAHSIDCCNENEEFDIYQVLAVRYYHEKSRKVTASRPFGKFGWKFEIIKFSSFMQTLFVGFVIALTQTWGSSVVVYKLWMAYFDDGFDSVECDMTEERWANVLSLKILALLLSLVVTFFIGILLHGVRHNGLYEIMDVLSLKHVTRIENVAIFFIQFGQFVNYYVCMTAILGSYFIIFISNQGEKEDDGSIDYSSAGLDMILNAVALFFILELDDMMVSDDDYEVCFEHLQSVLENYKPDVRINEDYKDHDEMDVDDDMKDDNDKEVGRERGQSVVQVAGNKCFACTVPVLYYLINAFAMLVTFFCYTGGFFAPFVIFFCW